MVRLAIVLGCAADSAPERPPRGCGVWSVYRAGHPPKVCEVVDAQECGGLAQSVWAGGEESAQAAALAESFDAGPPALGGAAEALRAAPPVDSSKFRFARRMIQSFDQRLETWVLAKRLERLVVFEEDVVLEALVDRVVEGSDTSIDAAATQRLAL